MDSFPHENFAIDAFWDRVTAQNYKSMFKEKLHSIEITHGHLRLSDEEKRRMAAERIFEEKQQQTMNNKRLNASINRCRRVWKRLKQKEEEMPEKREKPESLERPKKKIARPTNLLRTVLVREHKTWVKSRGFTSDESSDKESKE